jgi:translocation and assembly module TamB
LAVDQLTLDASIIGERVQVSLAGSASLDDQAMRATLDLHRIDGNPGSFAFRFGLSGTPAVLTLRLTADEPTGTLLDHVLHRGERLPLSLSLTGDGSLAAWRGRLEASAGALARFDADISLAGLGERSIALSAVAAINRLLPPDMAPLIGEHVPLALSATVKETGAIVIDNLAIEFASGTLTGDAALAGPDRAIAAHLRANFPRLAEANDVLGVKLQGSAELNATISGTEDRPRLDLDASGENIGAAVFGAEHTEAHLTVTSAGNAAARIDVAAQGQVRGVASSALETLSAAISRDLTWSLAARAAPDGSTIEVTGLSARGVGLDLAGSGVFDQGPGALDGRVRLSVEDLRPFAELSGHPLEGALTLEATAEPQQQPDRIVVKFDGSIDRLRTGVPVVDALGGGSVVITGAGQRDAAGIIHIERLMLGGAGGGLEASGHFDPATRQLAAMLDADIRH